MFCEKKDSENGEGFHSNQQKQRVTTIEKYSPTNLNEKQSSYQESRREDSDKYKRNHRYNRNFSTAFKNFEKNLTRFLPQTLADNSEKGFYSFENMKTGSSKK